MMSSLPRTLTHPPPPTPTPHTHSEVYALMERGAAVRATGATKLNELSSRSHAIFQLIVERSSTTTPAVAAGGAPPPPGDDAASTRGFGSAPGAAPGEPRQSVRVGKLNLVDLAGSERVHVTGATGKRLEESKKINQSLSALGNVIAALTDPKGREGRPHVPYRCVRAACGGWLGGAWSWDSAREPSAAARWDSDPPTPPANCPLPACLRASRLAPCSDSKLTRILEDSLGGNCKTTFMAMLSPAVEAFAGGWAGGGEGGGKRVGSGHICMQSQPLSDGLTSPTPHTLAPNSPPPTPTPPLQSRCPR